MWYFQGACVKRNLVRTGTTFKLKTYKRITMAIASGKNDAPGSLPFIVGNGTGSTDITGTLHGLKFPEYGKVPCFSGSLLGAGVATCRGSAIVYVLFLDDDKAGVTLATMPTVRLTKSGKFPGNTCYLDVLIHIGSGASSNYAWLILTAVSGQPTGDGMLTLAGTASTDDGTGFGLPGREFYIFGIHCQ